GRRDQLLQRRIHSPGPGPVRRDGGERRALRGPEGDDDRKPAGPPDALAEAESVLWLAVVGEHPARTGRLRPRARSPFSGSPDGHRGGPWGRRAGRADRAVAGAGRSAAGRPPGFAGAGERSADRRAPGLRGPRPSGDAFDAHRVAGREGFLDALIDERFLAAFGAPFVL